MINQIFILTDYKGFFGSKQKAKFYRGGMDLDKLSACFSKYGIQVTISSFTRLEVKNVDKESTLILYTSSEDKHGFYKDFIEDIIFHLDQVGYNLLPSYACLKAHNNKVAMELLRERSTMESIKTIHSAVFGTLDELIAQADNFIFPVVIKPASGAMSRGVSKAENPKELVNIAKKISRSFNLKHNLKELLRNIKYRKSYVRESFYRSKFIVQNMIKNLGNDWKVLVYGPQIYVLQRNNRKNDFRASGSGDFLFTKELPDGMLDFAQSVRNYFNVPHISLDIGFDGKRFHLIEFQFINFGTTTIEKSPFYFEKFEGKWIVKEGYSDLEKVYVTSLMSYLSVHVK
ncbi:protein containing ATP-grasp domain [Lentimicrobium saccharophilum]|uniref:Protein containing ATP-grasp domain n=1 Tax=Lentimicrobium saccharophilum TaxID=1678841 RepID=A0A0S7BZY1_9BACT|nr:hypothetical protein [Lentimicrobium saccharophilum]GAP42361.1 protein containing ATP-grasp domain [Lentimicrobium saccharophilum]